MTHRACHLVGCNKFTIMASILKIAHQYGRISIALRSKRSTTVHTISSLCIPFRNFSYNKSWLEMKLKPFTNYLWCNIFFRDFGQSFIKNKRKYLFFRRKCIFQPHRNFSFFDSFLTKNQQVQSSILTSGPSPVFGQSVNPISTRGGKLCPPQYYKPPPWIFRPCDGPGRHRLDQKATNFLS